MFMSSKVQVLGEVPSFLTVHIIRITCECVNIELGYLQQAISWSLWNAWKWQNSLMVVFVGEFVFVTTKRWKMSRLTYVSCSWAFTVH